MNFLAELFPITLSRSCRWIAALMLLLATDLDAQDHCLNYTSQDGLPSDHVTCGVSDQDGFMWFGTAGGVCWFDGRRFVDYSNTGSGEPPGATMIKCIEVDADNNIWVGTEREGIYKFDRKAKEWIRYHRDAPEGFRITDNEIHTLQSSADGTMWYGGRNSGLAHLDVLHNEVHHYYLDSFPRRNRWPNVVYDIEQSVVDSQLLLFASQGFIFQFNIRTESIELLEHQEVTNEKTSGTFSPTSIAQVNNGNIWIGTWSNGSWEYDVNQKSLVQRKPSVAASDHSFRNLVSSNRENEVWMSHRMMGVSKYNYSSQVWETFQPEPYNRNGLIAADFTGSYTSTDNNTWIFTTKGLSLIVPEHQAFRYYDNKVEKLNFFLDSYYNPETEEYLMAYAGEHGAFKVMDKNFEIKQRFNIRKEPTFQSIFKIRNIDDQTFLISDKLYEYKRGASQLTAAQFPGLKHEGFCTDILKDDLGKYWLLYSNHVLVSYDPITQLTGQHVIEDHLERKSPFYRYLDIEEMGDNIWAAAASELVIRDKSNGRLISSFHFENEEIKRIERLTEIEQRGFIEQIVPVDDNCAWILMDNQGMIKVCYDSRSDELNLIERRTKKDLPQLQSPIDMVRGLNNDYWIATHNGLVHADDAVKNFRVFNQSHGLISTKLDEGLSFTNDRLFVGMPKGFVTVDVKQLLEERPPLSCTLVSMTMDNIEIGEEEPIFNYKQNDLSIEAATPNYHDARSVQYAHRLTGINDDWVYTADDQYNFQYDNLPPGEYLFEVKSKSESLGWSDVESVNFEIQAPYWERLWFRLLSLIFILSLIYLVYKLRMQRELEKEKVNSQMAELENIALRSQMNPHFIFNALNSIKSLMLLDRKGESIKYLTHFSKMVREVLLISQETLIPLERELTLLSLYIEMEQLRFNESFQYKLKVDPEIDISDVMIPPLLIQPYVENAIWHGLMHMEGPARLNIDVIKNSNNVNIIITDNGIGRAASKIIADKSLSHRKKHLGMDINQRRIELMNQDSTVLVEDLYAEDGSASGTKVTIQLMIGL